MANEELCNKKPVKVRPHHLMCLHCLKGGGDPPDRETANLDGLLAELEADRNTLLTLETAFDCMGGPTTFPTKHDPATRRKDLQVLRALNLVPDETRCAFWMLGTWMPDKLPTLEGICELGGESGPAWKECPVAYTGAYEKGLAAGIVKQRTKEEMEAAKKASCEEMYAAERLRIRAHHLLCMMGYYGSGREEPLAADNLYEAIVIMRENPEIEVELIEGACMICPPCSGYDPGREICDAGCALRDRLKDLNTFQVLGLQPGDVRTARELYDLIWERIPDIRAICENPGNLIPEWANCGGVTSDKYQKARDRGKFTE
jgi:hypothetical protein